MKTNNTDLKVTKEELFKEMRKKVADVVKEFFEKILIAEREEQKQQYKDQSNGFYTRTVNSALGGTIEGLKFPRLRRHRFRSQLVGFYQRSVMLGDLIFLLTLAGKSASQISTVLKQVLNVQISASTIRRVILSGQEIVERVTKSPLPEGAFALWLDGIHLDFRQGGTTIGGVVLVAMAMFYDGTRQVVGIMPVTSSGESANLYEDLLQNLRDRGLKNVEWIITDGLKGIDTVIKKHYPMAKHQLCTVHVMRNIKRRVQRRDVQGIITDFKQILESATYEEALKRFKQLAQTWQGKYPRLIKNIEGWLPQILAYMELPPWLRRYVRTTNVIERFMRQVRETVGRGVLTGTEYRTEVLICFVASEYNRRSRKIKDVALFEQWLAERSQNKHQDEGN